VRHEPWHGHKPWHLKMIEEYHLVKELKDRLKLNSGIVSLELPYPVKRIKKFSK
jgi:hypothetical protein